MVPGFGLSADAGVGLPVVIRAVLLAWSVRAPATEERAQVVGSGFVVVVDVGQPAGTAVGVHPIGGGPAPRDPAGEVPAGAGPPLGRLFKGGAKRADISCGGPRLVGVAEGLRADLFGGPDAGVGHRGVPLREGGLLLPSALGRCFLLPPPVLGRGLLPRGFGCPPLLFVGGDTSLEPLDDHREALRAAGRFAATAQVLLSPAQLERIARVTCDAELLVPLVDQLGSAISTDQILAVLAYLGRGYADLSTSGATPTFPNDSHHFQVLTRLKQEEHLSRVTRHRTKSQISVTVA